MAATGMARASLDLVFSMCVAHAITWKDEWCRECTLQYHELIVRMAHSAISLFTSGRSSSGPGRFPWLRGRNDRRRDVRTVAARKCLP